MASMAQLNIRLDPALKEAGDSVLNLMGVTPSQFIRTIWMKLARGAEAFDQIATVLISEPTAEFVQPPVARDEKSLASQRIIARQHAFEQSVALNPNTYMPISEEELEEFVYLDFIEREEQRKRGDIHAD